MRDVRPAGNTLPFPDEKEWRIEIVNDLRVQRNRQLAKNVCIPVQRPGTSSRSRQNAACRAGQSRRRTVATQRNGTFNSWLIALSAASSDQLSY